MINKINDEIKLAMINKNKTKIDTLRLLKAEIKNKEIDTKTTLDDNEIISIIQKQIKLRKDSITSFEQANRKDLIEKTSEEVTILNEYLPKQLDEDEIKTIVVEKINEVNAISIKDIGKVMAAINPILRGKCDMSIASNIVNKILKGE